MSGDELSQDDRERFENQLRWHFNAAIEEGKGSVYVGLGIENALLDLAHHIAAKRERWEAKALRDWIDEWPITDGERSFLGDVARAGRDRADRIDGGAPS